VIGNLSSFNSLAPHFMASTSPTSVASPAAPPKKSSIKWIILIAVMIVIGLGAAVVIKRKGQEKVTVVTVDKAVIKTITQLVNPPREDPARGRGEDLSEVAGEIVELPVREGSVVKKGDLLMRIKPDTYQAQVEQREADLVAAKAGAVPTGRSCRRPRRTLQAHRGALQKKLVPESDFTAGRTARRWPRPTMTVRSRRSAAPRALLKQARDQLGRPRSYSPIDGAVSSLTSEKGERVVGTGSVCRHRDHAHGQPRRHGGAGERERERCRQRQGGRRARIAIDAYPNRRFNGVVKEIASAARPRA
jgi:HlyD family secretion protein